VAEKKRKNTEHSDQAGEQSQELIQKVVSIKRVAKVIKGGRHFSFNALTIVGDGKGNVGYGFGKANEVADSIKKSFKSAQKNMVTIYLSETTVPHQIIGRFGAAKVLLKPASAGTGVIAGGPVRAICEACGIKDVLTKSLGSNNPINMTKAMFKALTTMKPYLLQQGRKYEIK